MNNSTVFEELELSIGTIHRFSRLVTLLSHKWLHVRLYLNVNLMTALNYKTWMVQTLKLN
jgi:hypothetical protein